MKARLLGVFCTTLIITLFWIVNAFGQSDIAVSDANAIISIGFDAPSAGLATALQQVANDVFGDYSNATILKTLVDVSDEMRTVLSKVPPHVFPDYASASRSATLTFPKALVNDHSAPRLVGTVTTSTGSTANSVTLRWQVNEFAQSTLNYGNAPGAYSQVITIDTYTSNSNVEVSNLAVGATYYGRVTMTDLSDNQGQSPEFTFSLTPRTGTRLVLIYAALDNNLGTETDQLRRLIRNVEQGAANPDITVRLFIDYPNDNNAYSYELSGVPCLMASNDPTCGGHYKEGQNFWRESEHSGHPNTLYTFVQRAINDHSDASKVIVSLVGHGSGWSANALPSQPSSWVDQPSESGGNQDRLGGFLWDDTLGSGDSGAQSMSTQTLGVALQWINNATGRKIDLLYLDACSMGMVEVADELAPYVDYLLASPNTAWTSFAYDAMLAGIDPSMSTEAIGLAWRGAESSALNTRGNEYPYTLTLYRLDQMDGLTTAVAALVNALKSVVTSQRATLSNVLSATDRYESDYDGRLDRSDDYGDLGSLLRELEDRAGSLQQLTAARNAVTEAMNKVTVNGTAMRGGDPYPYPGQHWEWPKSTGISVYLPDSSDPKRSLYTADNLRWVQRTGWNQFLDAMGLLVAADATGAALPTCTSTTTCNGLPAQLPMKGGVNIYLPVVLR